MKKHKTEDSAMKTVKDGLVTAALGIAAGIALVPEAGKKFGSDIKKKSDELRADIVPKIEKIKNIAKGK